MRYTIRVRQEPYTVDGYSPLSRFFAGGRLLTLSTRLRGVMRMQYVTYGDLFQLLLVIIGILGLFLQYLAHKKK